MNEHDTYRTALRAALAAVDHMTPGRRCIFNVTAVTGELSLQVYDSDASAKVDAAAALADGLDLAEYERDETDLDTHHRWSGTFNGAPTTVVALEPNPAKEG